MFEKPETRYNRTEGRIKTASHVVLYFTKGVSSTRKERSITNG